MPKNKLTDDQDAQMQDAQATDGGMDGVEQENAPVELLALPAPDHDDAIAQRDIHEEIEAVLGDLVHPFIDKGALAALLHRIVG